MMGELMTGPRMVDFVIALSVLEGLALAVYHRTTGRGVAPADYALNLASGLCLMLALRSLLAQGSWGWPSAWLLAAGLAHWTDLWRRWKRQPVRPS